MSFREDLHSAKFYAIRKIVETFTKSWSMKALLLRETVLSSSIVLSNQV